MLIRDHRVALTFHVVHNVPIASTWSYCVHMFSYIGGPSYAMQDMKISLSPNPPLPGKNLTITASGTLSKLDALYPPCMKLQ